MAITKPKLPPKAGYVEVEVNGKRTYKNAATGVLIEDEVQMPSTEERIAELEAALATTDEAIIALFEAQGGMV